MPELDAPTLLIVLVLSNALIAGALSIAFAGAFRAGLGKWTGALMAQGIGWIIALAPDSTPDRAAVIAAGALIAYGCFLQIGAVLEFYKRPVSPWLLNGLSIAAFLGLAAWGGTATSAALSAMRGSGDWLLALYAVSIVGSFSFLLMHKVRARHLYTTDSLTGVYNRRMFNELAQAELSRARRTSAPVSLLALDLDRFKRVNDDHGHLVGDEVLVAFAALVRGCLRKEDLLARYGGEEFVALLPGANQSAATSFAERIRKQTANTELRAAGRRVTITVSVGVASERGPDLPSLEVLLCRADKALYAAKSAGRNRVVTAAVPLPPRLEAMGA